MNKTAAALGKMLRKKEIQPEELLEKTLVALEEKEREIRAFITKTYDFARTQKLGVESIPIAIKDNICVAGILTTCGSAILQNFKPPYSATVVQRLLEKGVPVVGKTNMDEFAMGSSCEHSAFFPTRNPWDLERVPGGSSGGSAAAVASGQVPWALGSDTGGSIRQPASFCGIVGLKPTYGLVSRYGLVAFASSLDQIGPLTLTVEDAALLLNIIAGHDPRDATSIPQEKEDYTEFLGREIRGVRIAILETLLGPGIEQGVKEKVEEAAKVLENLGAFVSRVELPLVEEALAVYYLIAPSECSSNLARYDGMSYGFRETGRDMIETTIKTRDRNFGPEVKRRIMIGTYALSAGYYDAYYRKAQKVRTLIRKAFQNLFEKYDLLLSPTAPTTAFPLGAKIHDPLSMYLSDLCTIPVNLAGICAVSVPCGLAGGLPVGLQLMGNVLEEKKLLQVAYAYEQARGPFLAPELISRKRDQEAKVS